MISSERVVITDKTAIQPGLGWKYYQMDIGSVGNISMLQVDIFKYIQKLPEYTTYANLYNQFWI